MLTLSKVVRLTKASTFIYCNAKPLQANKRVIQHKAIITTDMTWRSKKQVLKM